MIIISGHKSYNHYHDNGQGGPGGQSFCRPIGDVKRSLCCETVTWGVPL